MSFPQSLTTLAALTFGGCGMMQLQTTNGGATTNATGAASSAEGRPGGGAPIADPDADAKADVDRFVDFGISRLKEHQRADADLFVDMELADRSRSAPPEYVALRAVDLKKAVADAIQSDIAAEKDGAAHWAGLTKAPPEAAVAAVEALKTDLRAPRAAELTFLEVRLIDTQGFRIEKSPLGEPTFEFKNVRILAKRAGFDDCVSFYGTVNHAYAGGGNYSTRWGSVANANWFGIPCPAK